MAGVLRERLLPHWLRLGLKAGAIAALMSGGTLLAFRLAWSTPRAALPQSIDGSLILVPALLALGVLAGALPAFLATTRTEAVLGSAAAFLVGADLLMIFSFVSQQLVDVPLLARSMPLGVVAAALSIPATLAALGAGPLASEFGFGQSAGKRAALGAGVAVVILALAGPFVV
jgi:hypothetical protein